MKSSRIGIIMHVFDCDHLQTLCRTTQQFGTSELSNCVSNGTSHSLAVMTIEVAQCLNVAMAPILCSTAEEIHSHALHLHTKYHDNVFHGGWMKLVRYI